VVMDIELDYTYQFGRAG